jgi:transglutaminase-like putative cysteine protease
MNAPTIAILGFISLIILAWLAIYLKTLPGSRRHPNVERTTLDDVTTLEDAIAACRRKALQGWSLVAYAQNLVACKFSYSRRNPWDSPARAFERGMGYCQQQALALKMIYDRLGIRSELVFALKCRFPPKVVHGTSEAESFSPHTWLNVTLDGVSKYVCPGDPANAPGVFHFEILSEIRPLLPWMQPFSHLGSVIENVKRDQNALRRFNTSRD